MNHPFVQTLQATYKTLRDPVRAARQQSYIKTNQPMYGITASQRKNELAKLLKEFSLSVAEYIAIADELWNSDHRDDMLASLDLVMKRERIVLTSENFHHFEGYLDRADNWDLLDMLAAGVLGRIFLKDRSYTAHVRSWVHHENKWVRRTALICQLKHRTETDTDLLTYAIEHTIHETDFFIRKAIGWALRSYGDYNPNWVLTFVESHPELSPLSKKEAIRKIV